VLPLEKIAGKDDATANQMDVLVYALKGLAWIAQRKAQAGETISEEGRFILEALFATITNANFDIKRIKTLTYEALQRKETLLGSYGGGESLPEFVPRKRRRP